MYIDSHKFDEYTKETEAKRAETYSKINELKKYADSLKNEITMDVEQSVKRTMISLKKSIFGNYKILISIDHAGGRPVNEKELEMLLKFKADKKETEILKDSKATKEDFQKNESDIR